MVTAASVVEPRRRGKDDGGLLNGSPVDSVRSRNSTKGITMNGKQMTNLAVAGALAGGLFAGSLGWAAAQDQPAGGGDAHQHGRGTPAASTRPETADDAMTSMVRDIMEEMMPGMLAEMMPDMMGQMMPSMMDHMLSHMMGGGMMGDGMTGDGMTGDGAMGGMEPGGQPGRDGLQAMLGMTDDQRAQMEAVVAEALDLTADELEARLADGESVREIAEEQGVDLADVHEAVMDEFAQNGS